MIEKKEGLLAPKDERQQRQSISSDTKKDDKSRSPSVSMDKREEKNRKQSVPQKDKPPTETKLPVGRRKSGRPKKNSTASTASSKVPSITKTDAAEDSMSLSFSFSEAAMSAKKRSVELAESSSDDIVFIPDSSSEILQVRPSFSAGKKGKENHKETR